MPPPGVIIIYTRHLSDELYPHLNRHMKKTKIPVALILMCASLIPLQSCIGSFALTHKVITWNNQVGSKFINELVFFAFWVLPVYEVTALADLLVLNSIEFWSGNNPLEASTKVVDTDQGRYYIACDGKGYDITIPGGEKIRLDFEEDSQTWSVIPRDGEAVPFMTMVDAENVRMIAPDGTMQAVSLTAEGLQAYKASVTGDLRAQR